MLFWKLADKQELYKYLRNALEWILKEFWEEEGGEGEGDVQVGVSRGSVY